MLMIIEACDNDDSRKFFIDLYLKYRKKMFDIAYKYVQDQHIAEDLVHDAMIKLIEKEPLLVNFECCTLTTYVVFTIRNTSISYLRRKQRDKRYVADMDDEQAASYIADSQPLPEEVAIMNEKIDEFGKVWMTLPEEIRDLLAGKYILGLSDAELAEQYGCKPSSIRVKLSRARRAALKAMEEGGIALGQA